MTHDILTDEQRDQATLYALSALSVDEALAFERHLAEGCDVCRAEVEALRAVASDLALTADPVAVPPRLRAHVLETAASEPAGSMAIIRREEGQWVELVPGFFRKDLTLTPGGNVFLIRMAPGTRAPVHGHKHVEHCFVVEGTALIAGQRLVPGDHHIAGIGTIHRDLWTDQGCVLLLTETAA